MSKVPISICMIAKNEEHFLEECLKRIKPYGMEIIITDTGSTDRTKEIAQKYADKVFDFEWINDFSAARNFCAEHASNNWIISLDCDEYVESIDVKSLRILMQKKPRYAGNIRMKMLVRDDNDELQYITEEVTRMYNRNYYHFDGAIHEQVIPFEWRAFDENNNPVLQCFLMTIDVVHQGYAQSRESMMEKQIRNMGIIEKALKETPDDPYLCFQMGQSLFITGNREEAVQYYEKTLKLNPPAHLIYVQANIMALAKTYMLMERQEDAMNLMKKYESQCKVAKFAFTQATIFQDCKQWMKALLYYIKAVSLPDKDELGVNLLHCYENIIKLYKGFGNEEMANLFQKQYEECLLERERVIHTAEK